MSLDPQLRRGVRQARAARRSPSSVTQARPSHGYGAARPLAHVPPYDPARARLAQALLANQRNPALERCLGAFERAEHAAHALVRLSAAYEQYLDWAAA
ncbi:MAG: hypothetical protein ACRD0K_15010, partial [Egibacteraceae bacterium]